MVNFKGIAAALAWLLATAPAMSQSFPEKPMKFIVPFSAGGSTDVTARSLAEAMSTYLGQSIIVENHPGAAGTLGAALVARARADGYTMLVGGVGPISVVPVLDPTLSYNPSKDLEAVGQITNNDYGLVVDQSSPLQTAGDLFQAARSRPGQITYMTTGVGGPLHVSMEYFAKQQGLRLNHIPYQGESQALGDLLAGRLDVAVMSVTTAAPLIQSNKVRMLALMSAKRSAVLPSVPTIREAGYDNYEIPVWLGLFVPHGTSPAAVTRLHEAMLKALQQEDVRERMRQLGADPVGGTREQFATFLASESARWRTRIAVTGIHR